MDSNCTTLTEYLTSEQLRSIRATSVSALDGNPHDVSVYYVVHLVNLLKICATPGILPRAAVQGVTGDLAGQQVQWRRDQVQLALGACHNSRSSSIERPLHACVNFFWNPNNLTTWAFQARALHQAAELGDERIACVCILEIPLSAFAHSAEYHWCASTVNLASRSPTTTFSPDRLTGAGNAWPWAEIFGGRDRLHNAAEFVVFRDSGAISAPVPLTDIRRVLVAHRHEHTARTALVGTPLADKLSVLHNSAVFPAPSTLLSHEEQFTRELTTLNRFGISTKWLHHCFGAFRSCEDIFGRALTVSDFQTEALATAQHGVGHTTRVMFWVMFLARSHSLDDRVVLLALAAAYLHDLARTDQLPGSAHGVAAAASETTRSVLASLHLDDAEAAAVRHAIQQHCAEESQRDCPHDTITQLLRDADALDRGRFDKPSSPNGCDPDRLGLAVFAQHPGLADAVSSLAFRIALFTRYENWSEHPCKQLVTRIESALRTCVHHQVGDNHTQATATALLDAHVSPPIPQEFIEEVLVGGFLPPYRYQHPEAPSECDAWNRHHSTVSAFLFASTCACDWGDSPIAAILENILCRGTPTIATRYITQAVLDLQSQTTTVDGKTVPEDLACLALVHRIQRAFTHLMAGKALAPERGKWRIAILGTSPSIARAATADFLDLLGAVLVLQDGKPLCPKIDLFVPAASPLDPLPEGSRLSVHTIPYGQYHALIDVRLDEDRSPSQRHESLSFTHAVVVRKAPSDAKATPSPLRCSTPIAYRVDPDAPEHMAALVYFLRNLFLKEEFRPGQIAVIKRALERKDAIALLPTGAGKSLTYQLPSLLQPGMTLVVDPLKSLMRDQDKSLKSFGIDRSVFINSSLRPPRIDAAMGEVAAGKFQFVFVSPERLQIRKFRNMLRSMEREVFAYCVVDEAHCVSEWGHDFRTSYLRLGNTARRFCPTSDENLPLLALTGTASYDVLSDVQKELGIQDSNSVVRPDKYERDELKFGIVTASPPAPARDLWSVCAEAKRVALKNLLDSLPDKLRGYTASGTFSDVMSPDAIPQASGLVFCPHKSGPFGAQTTATALREMYPKLAPAIDQYHGADQDANGVGDEELDRIQTAFMKGTKTLLSCTKAFGMGIDKPNIRFTVHFSMPQSIEAFYQEAGRAGRDHHDAYCGLIYTDTPNQDAGGMDWSLLMSFHNNSFPGRTRDAAGLAELLLGHDLLRGRGDQWSGLEAVLSTMRPRESRSVVIPFENYGVTAVARTVSASLNKLVDEHVVKDALFFCNEPNQFVGNLESACLGRGRKFVPDLAQTLKKLFNATRREPETFRAVYRLLILGLLDDYEFDYGHRQIHGTLVRLDDAAMQSNLIAYLTRYLGRHDRRVFPETINQRLGQSMLQKCCGHLLDFVYSEIAAKRHRAIENMQSALQVGLKYGIDEFARRINTYFDSRFSASLVDDLREKPVETIVDAYIMSTQGRPDETEHLWGSCDRLIETNPTHAGLFLLRAFAKWVSNRSLQEAGRDAQTGYDLLADSRSWDPLSLAVFQNQFISWIASVNPDAANIAMAHVLGQHVGTIDHYWNRILGKE